MIASFRDTDTERLWLTGRSRRLPADLWRRAFAKLIAINSATELQELASPPGNRLEALRGDRKGQHSIRVSDRYRICFVWRDGHAYNVELVDYH